MRRIDPVKHEEKRQEILEAAVRCFVKYGFHGASISQICSEAGMSAGHLYHYFPSKESMVEAIIDANLQRAEQRFSQALQQRGSVLDVLTDELRHSALSGGDRTPLLFDMFAESRRNPSTAKMLGRHSHTMQTFLVELLRRGQAQGEIDASLDPTELAPVFMSLLDGMKTLELRNPDLSPSHFEALLQTLIVRFLSLPKQK